MLNIDLVQNHSIKIFIKFYFDYIQYLDLVFSQGITTDIAAIIRMKKIINNKLQSNSKRYLMIAYLNLFWLSSLLALDLKVFHLQNPHFYNLKKYLLYFVLMIHFYVY